MGNNSAISCLSAEDHDTIKDHLVHYFGCLQFSDRAGFLDPNHKIWTDEKIHQIQLLEKARNAPNTINDNEIEQKAKEQVDAIRERWRKSFDKELGRIELIRSTLERDDSDNLVREVNACREEWQAHRKERFADTQELKPPPPKHSPAADVHSDGNIYVPEKDVSVGIIQFDKGEPFNEDCASSNNRTKGPIWGKFPDQKTSVQSLLFEGNRDNPIENMLHKDRIRDKPDRIRYFHIPLNNMSEAISRYFGESRPKLDSFNRQLGREEKTRSSMILQDRYWRGQLHADESDPPHARYLSPICETISSEPEATDSPPTSLVLFMPYLHWETSKNRKYFASEIIKIMTTDAKEKDEDEETKRLKRIEKRKRTSTMENEPQTKKGPSGCAAVYNYAKAQIQTIRSLKHQKLKTWQINNNREDDGYGEGSMPDVALSVTKRPRFKIEAPLAKYLMAMSKLHEGMANYRDKMLLSKYLPHNPPLHPRRTLDQAFYWTLRSTKKRDTDQVVFRGTTAKPDDFHHFDVTTKRWPKHEEYNIQGSCPECAMNIQKLSRVIMVDQLWMWILDANTIITCFPKRYGANKNDASGIHKSIRSRVEEIKPVHTIFEIGLVILDECSKTFFDSTRTLDRRPQVINEFSRAIGNIMNKQTIAFQRLWWWTEQVKFVYRAKGYTDTSGLHMTLLDIKPEGDLDREIEDILEELDIMLHLAHTHNDILTKFIDQAERILDPKGEFKGKNGLRPQGGANAEPEYSDSYEDGEKREIAYRCFKKKANEGQARALGYIMELEKLRESAKKTADDVLHLLSMKQQQASVFQAWQAMKQSDETIKQGRSIMTFTLVTIVFLPLSFLSSVFGMNNKDFGNDNWPISRQFLYIFSISAGVVLFILPFAFSPWIRAHIWSLYVRSSTTVAVRSGLYDLYLERPTKLIYKDAANSIYRVKRDRREEYFKLKGAKRLELEELEETKHEESGAMGGNVAYYQTTVRTGYCLSRGVSLSP
ncbi:hypothetical protein F5Y09DRAFT_350393 [Xylaria sp. FL1042]|nr:hypothetical protein F5Y09DRAFT_350393 [Xylaria sp. FL1042]